MLSIKIFDVRRCDHQDIQAVLSILYYVGTCTLYTFYMHFLNIDSDLWYKTW